MPSIPASHADLLDAAFATFGTIADDGSPQLTELWFLAEDGAPRISLNTSRHKVHNLTRDPRCSLLILDLQNPHRYLEIRGTARLEPDTDYAFADRVGAKYGADLRTMDRPGESRVVVSIEPTRVNAVDLSA